MSFPVSAIWMNGRNPHIDLRQLYTSDGLKFIVARQIEFFRERPYGTLNGRLIPLMLITAGGIIGFHAATKAAEMLKIKRGVTVLQGGGTVMGCAAGAYAYASLNEKNIFFQTWKFLKISSQTNDFVFEKYKDDLFLNQFVDCISYNPLKVPVRLPTGYLIDLDNVKELPRDADEDTICPHTRGKLDINNLNVDLELHTLILKRVQYLLQSDLDKAAPETEAHSMLEMQLKVIEKQLEVSFYKHLNGLKHLHKIDRLTSVESNRLHLQFFSHFGVEPLGKKNAEKNIEAHTMDFDLNWKEIITEHSKIIFKGSMPTQFVEV